MKTIQLSEEIHRRRFLGIAAMTVAAAEFGMIGSANAQSSKAIPSRCGPTTKPGTNTSFALTEADRCRPPECWIR